MDSIDDIEAKNNRNLETAELVSAYMRANAQRAAQRAAQQLHSPEVAAEEAPQEPEGDKLDFSSEFSTGDMGLSSQGGAAELLAWKQAIEDEEEQESDQGDDEKDQDEAEEWQSGGWQDKDDEEQPEESDKEDSEPEEEPSPTSTHAPSLPQPSTPTPPSEAPTTTKASAPASIPAKPEEVATALEAAQQFWDGEPQQSTTNLGSTTLTKAVEPPLESPVRTRPAPETLLPLTGRAVDVDFTLAQLARKLIVSPSEQPGYEECVRLLARFGAGALRICSREKVQVEILDEHDFATHPELHSLALSPEERPTDGAYLVENRKVLVERRCLIGKPRFFHPALYYFAHAFDHAQGGDTFSSRKAAAVVACFEASTRAHSGFDFVDELAAADPVRYFARSIAVYLGQDDCSDPLWSHQDLYDFDRSMYDYLQYLFARLGS